MKQAVCCCSRQFNTRCEMPYTHPTVRNNSLFHFLSLLWHNNSWPLTSLPSQDGMLVPKMLDDSVDRWVREHIVLAMFLTEQLTHRCKRLIVGKIMFNSKTTLLVRKNHLDTRNAFVSMQHNASPTEPLLAVA